MKSLFTEIQCAVNFGKMSLGAYITRVNLFKTEFIQLKGDWSSDSVIKYCKTMATKKGYKNVILEIHIYDQDYNEKFVKVEI